MSKTSDKDFLIGEANSPKAHLINLYKILSDMHGTKGAARELDRIIRRLEAWQHRHKGKSRNEN